MEQLDDFFKKKMEERAPFELKGAYWEEMESMLEEKKRKRRFAFWWWWGSGLLVLLLLAGGIWSYASWDVPKSEPLSIESTTPLVPSVQESSPLQEPIATVEPSASTPLVNAPSQKIISKTTLTKKNEINNSNPIFQQPISPTSQAPLIEDTISASSEGKKEPSAASLMDNELLPSLMSENESTLSSRNEQFNSPLIPTLDFELVDQEGLIDSLSLAIELAKTSKWHFELEGASTWYPYFNGSETAIGTSFGINTSYEWNPNWSLLMGIAYRYRTGSFDFAKAATISNFRFGREDQRFFLLPESLHYLELPVGIRWTNGRHQLEGGLRLSYLMGVRGSLESAFEGEGNPFGNTQQEEEGWLEEDGFVQWHLDGFVGYGFRLNSRWAVWTRANYTIPGLLDGNYPSPFGLQLKESKPVFVDIGLRFYWK